MLHDQFNEIGLGFHAKKDFRNALRNYRMAAKLAPDNAQIQFNLGRVLQDMHEKPERIIHHYRRSIELDPKFIQGHVNYGMALEMAGKRNEALKHYFESVKLCPTVSQWNNMGIILEDMGRISEAILCLMEACRVEPAYSEGLLNLTCSLGRAGRTEEAMRCFKKALKLNPRHAQGRSNILFMMQHQPGVDPMEIRKEHEAWNQLHAAHIKPRAIHPKPVDGRRIRIGYVSGDFKKHVVASNLEPVIRHHDKSKFEIFLYFNLALNKQDKVTQRFKRYADRWRVIHGLSDDLAADQIVRDGIDVLVDLSGHTADNRLLMFAQRPAPKQVHYLGYVSTTGMTCFDARITDAHCDPPGADQYYTEPLMRISGSSCVYQPFDDADAPTAAAPWLETKPIITLGSCNNVAKTTPEVVEAWSRILVANCNARLLLKARTFSDTAIKERYKAAFMAHGVKEEQLFFVGWAKTERDHMSVYNLVDLCLDTWPFNGGITSFEALYMGVPLVTLAGDYFVRRMTYRLLAEIGLHKELVAYTVDEYVDLVNHLIRDPKWLVHCRYFFRGRLQKSSLMDGPGLCVKLENVFERLVKI